MVAFTRKKETTTHGGTSTKLSYHSGVVGVSPHQLYHRGQCAESTHCICLKGCELSSLPSAIKQTEDEEGEEDEDISLETRRQTHRYGDSGTRKDGNHRPNRS